MNKKELISELMKEIVENDVTRFINTNGNKKLIDDLAKN